MNHFIYTIHFFVSLFFISSSYAQSSLDVIENTIPSSDLIQRQTSFSDDFCSLTNTVLEGHEPNFGVGIFSDIDCSSCLGNSQILAVPFTASQNMLLEDICFPGFSLDSLNDGNCANVTSDIQVEIYDDAGGIPGNLIAGPYTGLPTSNLTTDFFFGDSPVIAATIDFPDFCLEGDSTIWIAFFGDLPSPCDYVVVFSNTSISASSRDGGATWLEDISGPSYFIGGTEIESCEPMDDVIIPTMGEWGLICLGLIFMIVGIVAVKLKEKQLLVQ